MSRRTKSYLQTGQTGCYDRYGGRIACAGSGQDAETGLGAAWQSRGRFDLHNGIVIDTATGLHRLRDAGFGEFPMTWQDSLEFIEHMNQEQVLGKRDWRLPNRRELRSLVSHQTTRPALPEQHPFENLFQGWYWTLTTAAISPSHAWNVHMAGGRMFYDGKDQSFMVWTVRGSIAHWLPATGQRAFYDAHGLRIEASGSGQNGAIQAGRSWPELRFSVGETGVIDHLTGLCWYRCANLADGDVSWEDELAGIAARTAGAYRTSTSWNHWLIAVAHGRRWPPQRKSSTGWLRSTGPRQPACMNPTGPGPCIWTEEWWVLDRSSRDAPTPGLCEALSSSKARD